MEIFKKGTYSNGIKIQCEDWSEDYPNLTNRFIVGFYPLSKKSKKGTFAPRKDKQYRFELNCRTKEECNNIFNSIVEGRKKPKYYKHLLSRPKYQDCI